MLKVKDIEIGIEMVHFHKWTCWPGFRPGLIWSWKPIARSLIGSGATFTWTSAYMGCQHLRQSSSPVPYHIGPVVLILEATPCRTWASSSCCKHLQKLSLCGTRLTWDFQVSPCWKLSLHCLSPIQPLSSSLSSLDFDPKSSVPTRSSCTSDLLLTAVFSASVIHYALRWQHSKPVFESCFGSSSPKQSQHYTIAPNFSNSSMKDKVISTLPKIYRPLDLLFMDSAIKCMMLSTMFQAPC